MSECQFLPLDAYAILTVLGISVREDTTMNVIDAHNDAYRTMPAAPAILGTRDGSGDGGLPAPSRQGRLLPVR